MQIMRWLGIIVAILLVAACFMPWVSIHSRHITVTGFETAGTDFGKPGLFHTVIAGIYILLLLLNKTWSLRTAFFVSALNIAWAVRNLLLIPACHGGECPEKHPAIYLVLIASLLMTLCSLFIDLKWQRKKS